MDVTFEQLPNTFIQEHHAKIQEWLDMLVAGRADPYYRIPLKPFAAKPPTPGNMVVREPISQVQLRAKEVVDPRRGSISGSYILVHPGDEVSAKLAQEWAKEFAEQQRLKYEHREREDTKPYGGEA